MGDPIQLLSLEERAHQGNAEITEWCATCHERVIPMRDGTCGWCGGALGQTGDAAVADEIVVPPRRDRRHLHGQPYSDEQIIQRVRLWADIHGAPPTKTDWDAPKLRKLAERTTATAERAVQRVRTFEEGDWPAESTVRERFGSVNAARVAAGYEVVAPGRPARSATPARAPKTGEVALRGYFREVAEARSARDAVRLKVALYVLAISAMSEADRIAPADDGAAA